MVSDITKTGQDLVFDGDYLNSNGAALNSITVGGVRSSQFNGTYELAQDISISLITGQTGGQTGDGPAGQLIVNGSAVFNPHDNRISLDNIANDFRGDVVLTTDGFRNATISDANDIRFSGMSVTGNLTAIAAGAVTDSTGANLFVGLAAQFNSAIVTLGDQVADANKAETTAINNASFNAPTITLGNFDPFTGDANANYDLFNSGQITFNSTEDVQFNEDSDVLLAGTSIASNATLKANGNVLDGQTASTTIANRLNVEGNLIDLGTSVEGSLFLQELTFRSNSGFNTEIETNSSMHLVGNSQAGNELNLETLTGSITDAIDAQTQVQNLATLTAITDIVIGEEATLDCFDILNFLGDNTKVINNIGTVTLGGC